MSKALDESIPRYPRTVTYTHRGRKEGRKEAQYAVVACRQTEIERLTDTSARLVKHPSVKVIALC